LAWLLPSNLAGGSASIGGLVVSAAGSRAGSAPGRGLAIGAQEGMLANASLASAKRAAECASGRRAERLAA
jgi:hypothetical protein